MTGEENNQHEMLPETPAASAITKYGFTGSYRHGIDAKGRLIIPASFRDALGKTFFVCESPSFDQIAVYPTKAWENRLNYYAGLKEKDPEVEYFLYRFTKFSYPDCELDGQGRLLLPSALRVKYLKDAKDIDINGSYDHVIVEESTRSKRADDEFDQMYPDPLRALSDILHRINQSGKE